MCGIAGKLNFNHQPINPAEIEAMNRTIAHRGPDDSGIYVNHNVGLGQTRLSIIDLSPAGRQPMTNEDQSVWIVFNGEIYNFGHLKPDLEARGHKFRSKTDTEVVIHAYEEYGIEGCLKKLRGMFALAIWDQNIQTLFLARDRIGKKPLKYYLDDRGLIFASELKAILADPRIIREPDYAAIDWYLSHQYVPAPSTGLRGIKKLPQAHYLVCQNGKIKIKRYWDLEYVPNFSINERQWCQKIIDKLDESVRIRMIADVPIGAFLSGGVDSSAVVASMALQSTQPVKTFSIGFSDQKHNELPHAKEVAELYQTDHTELIVEPKGIEVLPKLIYHYEEPYADSSALPTFYVSELTRSYVTVALNGDGGDENFFGYPWHKLVYYTRFFETLKPLVARGSKTGNFIHRHYPSSIGRNALAFFESFGYSPKSRHFRWISYFNQFEKDKIYSKELKDQVRPSPVWDIAGEQKTDDVLAQTILADIKSYLADDLVVKVDIASMAVALETRSPLLDHEFMELASTIPTSLRIKNGQTKSIFKKALETRLPNSILYRKKQGFGIPIDHWFRNDLKQLARDVIMDNKSISRGLFNRQEIENMLSEHTSGKVNHGKRIWALLTLEMWFRTFIDQPNHIPATINLSYQTQKQEL